VFQSSSVLATIPVNGILATCGNRPPQVLHPASTHRALAIDSASYPSCETSGSCSSCHPIAMAARSTRLRPAILTAKLVFQRRLDSRKFDSPTARSVRQLGPEFRAQPRGAFILTPPIVAGSVAPVEFGFVRIAFPSTSLWISPRCLGDGARTRM
jgi:hypothetical protein